MPSYYRLIPKHVRRQLTRIEGDEVTAGCIVEMGARSIGEGDLSHLGITLDESGLHYESDVLPSPRRGKYSLRNAIGWVDIRHDLPKESYTVPLEAPNWHGSGTHTVYQSRERYPKVFHAPRFSTIRIEIRDGSPGLDKYVIAYQVSEVLRKADRDFEDRLLSSINLLQENVGVCGVVKAGASFDEYARSVKLTWEVLPPGSKDEVVARIFRGKTPSPQQRTRAEDRYDFLMSLEPRAMIYGRSGFLRYFGAQLEDNLVVFENIDHGNAIYVMFSDWVELSQRSRLELLTGRYGRGFERVVHIGAWKARAQRLINMRRHFDGRS